MVGDACIREIDVFKFGQGCQVCQSFIRNVRFPDVDLFEIREPLEVLESRILNALVGRTDHVCRFPTKVNLFNLRQLAFLAEHFEAVENFR